MADVAANTQNRNTEWIVKEMELTQRHEQLLKRREALLRTTECYFDARRGQKDSFVTDSTTADNRNRQLLQEMNESINKLKDRDKPSSQLNRLVNNYWVMVRGMYPIWSQEVLDYEQRKLRLADSTDAKASRVSEVSNSQSAPANQRLRTSTDKSLLTPNMSLLNAESSHSINATASDLRSNLTLLPESTVKSSKDSKKAGKQTKSKEPKNVRLASDKDTRTRSASSSRLQESKSENVMTKEKTSKKRATSQQRLATST